MGDGTAPSGGPPRSWRVAGAIVEADDGLLLVANRRRDGRVDWSPPGGVIDPGETTLGALTREVREETGLVIDEWSEARYEIEVRFEGLDMDLHVAAFQALRWRGRLEVADPDGIVTDAGFFAGVPCAERLDTSPAWVRDPLVDWLSGRWLDARHYAYRAEGSSPRQLQVTRL